MQYVSNKEKWEEVERLQEAGRRLVERARADKSVAEQFLRDMGYYETMEAQRAWEEEQRQAQAAADGATEANVTHNGA